MFSLISFRNQYSGNRTAPTKAELKLIIEAIKVEHEDLIIDDGGYPSPIYAEAFRDGETSVSVCYESMSGYFYELKISKTEEGKFYVTVTDGDDESSFMMMDEIKDFEEIEL